jgi:hypothetical protein
MDIKDANTPIQREDDDEEAALQLAENLLKPEAGEGGDDEDSAAADNATAKATGRRAKSTKDATVASAMAANA